MTGIWFCDIFTNGKRTILFNDILRNLTLHTEVTEKGKIESEFVENTRNLPYTVRSF